MSDTRRPADPMTAIVARFHYRYEAELAKGFLDDAAIESILFIDDAGGMEVGLAFANPARIVVRARDLDRARELLTAAGLGSTQDDASSSDHE